MPNSRANSRTPRTCSAEATSLFGVKWSMISATRAVSKTFFAPMARNDLAASGAVMSLARTRLTLQRTICPGPVTASSVCRAMIFSAKV